MSDFGGNLPFPNRIRYWNKVGVNHLMRRVAQLPFGPFCLVEHAGRHTGKVYQTPIVAFRQDDLFIVALTYGNHVDWYKNILATGACRIYWHHQWYEISQISSISRLEALKHFPLWMRGFVAIVRVRDYINLHIKTT